jgi:ABC-type bacteriocin/lantibiotic exporter with double-glycine peptidase domain
MELISKIFNILDKKDKIHFFVLLFVIFFSMILEMLSIGLLIPITTLIIETGETALSSYNFLYLDNFLQLSKQVQIKIILFVFVLIYLFKSVYLTLMVVYLNSFSYNLKAKLSRNLFKSYLNKKFQFFIDNNSSLILRNIKDEPDLFVIHVFKPILLLFVDCFLIIGIVVVLIFYEPLISSFVIILLTFAGYIFLQITNKRIINSGLIRQKSDASRIKNIIQAFNNIVEIMILNVRKTILEKYKLPNDKSAIATKMSTIFQELPRVWLEMIGIVGLLAVVSIMIYLDREMDEIIPVIGLFALAAFKILPTINRILASLTSIKFSKPVLSMIQKNLEKTNKKISKKSTVNLRKNIIFKNVSFLFHKKNKQHQIFKNLNLKIDKNSSIAIIGESGSGKSTFLNLLLGFFEPSSGKIFIDNKNLKKISNEWLNNIGYVSQLTNITDDSIKRNIAFGLEDHKIDKKKIFEVIKKSNLTNFIKKLPKGINTILGEKGVKISGGQRQRISIARALYNNPSIIIFDEATNALDVATENKIINEIIKLKKEKTVIFVTHRTNNLKKFDIVYEVKNQNLKKK